jgi:hypothetical protein
LDGSNFISACLKVLSDPVEIHKYSMRLSLGEKLLSVFSPPF